MRKDSFGCRGSKDRVGVLLAQLGTPDEPTPSALRRYLKQFLSDRRVIEVNRALWWVILNGIILNTRPKRSAALYKRVWTERGSPLMVITQSQTEKLAAELKGAGHDIEVAFGMRYGNPSLESAIDDLIARGCARILLVPLYPQYSASTSASTYDAVFAHVLKRRWVPTLRVAEPFYNHPGFLKAVATRVNETLAASGPTPERLLVSYHGVPQSYVEKGDPYCCMCTETTQGLVPFINYPREQVMQVYQSRFGRDPWLVPYADETIEKLGHQGVKHLAVVLPGFIADCLETVDEMGVENSELFIESGGESLRLVPCVNDHPAWIKGLSEIVIGELGSWLETNKRRAGCDVIPLCPYRAEVRRAGAAKI